MAIRGCEICKQPIEEFRREIQETQLCQEHAEKARAYGGEFRTVAEEERISKPGSLKHNVGGVTTRMVRNHAAIEKVRADYEREKYGE